MEGHPRIFVECGDNQVNTFYTSSEETEKMFIEFCQIFEIKAYK